MTGDGLLVLDHPLLGNRLATLRDVGTATPAFRAATRQIGGLLAWEMTRGLPTLQATVQTPLEAMSIELVDERKVVIVSILRAGNALVDGMLDVVPGARVGHLGLARDPETLEAREYYAKLPPDLDDCVVLVADPMLATANTAVAAIHRIRALASPRVIRFGCLLAAPEGVRALRAAHPEVAIFTAALDRQLNDHGYIMPGLGDAGDRIYGTA